MSFNSIVHQCACVFMEIPTSNFHDLCANFPFFENMRTHHKIIFIKSIGEAYQNNFLKSICVHHIQEWNSQYPVVITLSDIESPHVRLINAQRTLVSQQRLNHVKLRYDTFESALLPNDIIIDTSSMSNCDIDELSTSLRLLDPFLLPGWLFVSVE